jgi:hypothetical protein
MDTGTPHWNTHVLHDLDVTMAGMEKLFLREMHSIKQRLKRGGKIAKD